MEKSEEVWCVEEGKLFVRFYFTGIFSPKSSQDESMPSFL